MKLGKLVFGITGISGLLYFTFEWVVLRENFPSLHIVFIFVFLTLLGVFVSELVAMFKNEEMVNLYRYKVSGDSVVIIFTILIAVALIAWNQHRIAVAQCYLRYGFPEYINSLELLKEGREFQTEKKLYLPRDSQERARYLEQEINKQTTPCKQFYFYW